MCIIALSVLFMVIHWWLFLIKLWWSKAGRNLFSVMLLLALRFEMKAIAFFSIFIIQGFSVSWLYLYYSNVHHLMDIFNKFWWMKKIWNEARLENFHLAFCFDIFISIMLWEEGYNIYSSIFIIHGPRLVSFLYMLFMCITVNWYVQQVLMNEENLEWSQMGRILSSNLHQDEDYRNIFHIHNIQGSQCHYSIITVNRYFQQVLRNEKNLE